MSDERAGDWLILFLFRFAIIQLLLMFSMGMHERVCDCVCWQFESEINNQDEEDTF